MKYIYFQLTMFLSYSYAPNWGKESGSLVVNEKGKSIFLKSDGKPNKVLSIRYDSTAEILILALLIIEEDHTTQPTRMPTVSTARASTS